MSNEIVSISNVTFRYGDGPNVLDIEKFVLPKNARAFLRGPSGSGKSTLLGIIAGILQVKSGTANILGVDFTKASGATRDRLRADSMGVIFQLFNLLPFLSVTDNVLLPLKFSKKRRVAISGDPHTEARRLLQRLGLESTDIHNRRVSDLSVGQQQRVAAARALIGSPKLIIADEPTSSLDEDAKFKFLKLLSEECSAIDAALLFVSHDRRLESEFEHVYDLTEINCVKDQTAGVT